MARAKMATLISRNTITQIDHTGIVPRESDEHFRLRTIAEHRGQSLRFTPSYKALARQDEDQHLENVNETRWR